MRIRALAVLFLLLSWAPPAQAQAGVELPADSLTPPSWVRLVFGGLAGGALGYAAGEYLVPEPGCDAPHAMCEFPVHPAAVAPWFGEGVGVALGVHAAAPRCGSVVAKAVFSTVSLLAYPLVRASTGSARLAQAAVPALQVVALSGYARRSCAGS